VGRGSGASSFEALVRRSHGNQISLARIFHNFRFEEVQQTLEKSRRAETTLPEDNVVNDESPRQRPIFLDVHLTKKRLISQFVITLLF
jgi:hypothetical protein